MENRINEIEYTALLAKKQGMGSVENRNGVCRMELHYETLIPVESPEDTTLSVGTVTFLVEGKELPLDFNTTEPGFEGEPDSTVHLDAILTGFEPQVFADDYQELGLTPADLNHDFFAARYSDTYLTEVYTEYFYTESEAYLPLVLKSACLIFQDGSFLDYSDRISESAQEQLAEMQNESAIH